jgi:hypothetical protein
MMRERARLANRPNGQGRAADPAMDRTAIMNFHSIQSPREAVTPAAYAL